MNNYIPISLNEGMGIPSHWGWNDNSHSFVQPNMGIPFHSHSHSHSLPKIPCTKQVLSIQSIVVNGLCMLIGTHITFALAPRQKSLEKEQD